MKAAKKGEQDKGTKKGSAWKKHMPESCLQSQGSQKPWGATAGKEGKERMRMGKKIDQELVGNGTGNRKGLLKTQIAGKGRQGGIMQLLAPGEGRWRQRFSLVSLTGKWIFHRVRGASELRGRKIPFHFTGTRALNGQMRFSGRWGRGREVHLYG